MLTPEQRRQFNLWRRQRYADLKARGKCVSCGVAFAQGGVRCRECALAILETVERCRSKRQPATPERLPR